MVFLRMSIMVPLSFKKIEENKPKTEEGEPIKKDISGINVAKLFLK